MIDIQTAFLLGIVSGENIDVKELIANHMQQPNQSFSILDSQKPSRHNYKKTRAYLQRNMKPAKETDELITFFTTWELNIQD